MKPRGATMTSKLNFYYIWYDMIWYDMIYIYIYIYNGLVRQWLIENYKRRENDINLLPMKFYLYLDLKSLV